jgi:hypothetical protein
LDNEGRRKTVEKLKSSEVEIRKRKDPAKKRKVTKEIYIEADRRKE